MRKIFTFTIRLIAGVAVIWMFFALNVAWRETERFAKMAKEEHALLKAEQRKTNQLEQQLRACSQNQ